MKRNNIIIILGVALLCLPIHISYGQGARYTGSYKKSSIITHNRKNNFVIEGLDFSDAKGDIIALYHCENVIIRNNRFRSSDKRGVYLYQCKNITIIDNTFENVRTALTAQESQGIKFEYNDVLNLGGLLALSDNTINGFATLFNKVTGAGNSISYNAIENIFGDSSPGDIINVNGSDGTSQSPIMVKGNWIKGGGPSPNGGGILLGDLGGSYQIAEDNILVDPGQYGIGIAGGHNMTIRNNKIYGKKQYFTNVALYAKNFYESRFGKSHTLRIENNIVNYTNRDGVAGNSWWISDNVKPVTVVETNKYDPSLSASILPNKILGRARSTTSPEDDKSNPDTSLPDIKNDPSIQIYLDSYNRVCVNVQGTLISPSAEIIGANNKSEIIYRQPLKRFHTVLPNRPAPGNYTIFVTNGDKAHMKTLYIP
ncbi:right-handed parallel beta-helix repeat-containing protein [Proteiniphilum saccharofermentans]|uniref:right-handed parallel beta-helix repeat-containing protein n=1 Tax=Proteiniphilum saccharofermentans TaxID=1642647 RepID=UPI0028ACCD98|nr:right-handed parallel beta-helix repeat-containing protein [Proteiniphilum saccharofermentans]